MCGREEAETARVARAQAAAWTVAVVAEWMTSDDGGQHRGSRLFPPV
jgi:hypothetical protein